MRRRDFLRGSALAVPALGLLGTSAYAGPSADDTGLPGRQAVLDVARAVNDHWIGGNAEPGDNGWARATYVAGCLAAYRLSGDDAYLHYASGWADGHHYDLVDGPGTRSADNQCAGQAYLDLYEVTRDEDRIAAIDESVHGMVDDNGDVTDWWWVDALHMAMPVFARLGALRGDAGYTETMHALYAHTKNDEGGGLWDAGAALWYRDSRYSPGGGDHRSPNGRPVFWSRGNGWALAAHAKVLAALPADDGHAAEYRDTFVAQAEAVRAVQRDDGFWNPSLGDPEHLPGRETSGTALFTYGLAYGVRTGLLERDTYLPTVSRAWQGMVADAVHEDGGLGFVQGVGYEPESSQPITEDSTADFGVGAFLLAAAQVAQLTG